MKVYEFSSEIDEEKFKKYKDQFMKEVESDLHLIAWLAYGLDILFRDKSYSEMKDFIGRVTEEELKEYLVKVENPSIYSIDNPGVTPDTIYDLFDFINKEKVFIGTLGIDNQIKEYSIEQKTNRSQFYICSLIFRQGRTGGTLDKSTYNNIEPVYHLWIYPEPAGKRSNKIYIDTSYLPQDRQILETAGSDYAIIDIKNFSKIKNVVFHFYLGNPLELTKIENEKNKNVQKLLYALRLVDLIFQFGIPKNERIKYLGDEYNLNSARTHKEIENMSELETLVNMFYQRDQEEIDELKKVIKDQGKELKDKDFIINDQDKEIKNKDFIIKDRDKEIKNKEFIIKDQDNKLKAKDLENQKLKQKLAEFESMFKDISNDFNPQST